MCGPIWGGVVLCKEPWIPCQGGMSCDVLKLSVLKDIPRKNSGLIDGLSWSHDPLNKELPTPETNIAIHCPWKFLWLEDKLCLGGRGTDWPSFRSYGCCSMASTRLESCSLTSFLTVGGFACIEWKLNSILRITTVVTIYTGVK